MRYSGGLAGGAWPAAMLADLGNGRFDETAASARASVVSVWENRAD
jgi:hypothetical protein